MDLLPISAVIPTCHRPKPLKRTLDSLARQSALPAEIIVIDASAGHTAKSRAELSSSIPAACTLYWRGAIKTGAAAQRNQGCAVATQPFIWFFDDDVIFERDCLATLWAALQSNPALGGVNAFITNQHYLPPGLVSRAVFAFMNRQSEKTYAGRVIGPAITHLPEDNEGLPEVVPVEWLNTTCTLYRREALPDPPFDSVFTGYSLMEDLTLSLRVARKWKLANARTARIFHDSQPGAHKSDLRVISRMELVNRHYVMSRVLGRTRLSDYSRLALWELFQLAVTIARGSTRTRFWPELIGKIQAVRDIVSAGSRRSAAP